MGVDGCLGGNLQDQTLVQKLYLQQVLERTL